MLLISFTPLSFILFFTLILFTDINVYGSDIVDFSKYIPASRPVQLISKSPQEELRTAYEKMRQISTFERLEKRANKFETYIFDPINKDNLIDQTEYLEEYN